MAGARPFIVVEGVGVAEDTQHQALYRRYRPQTPSDLLGQEHVVRALTGAVREGRLHHAFLFCGPRGTGKTSTARILAKMVNCENGPTAEPCGTCEQCVRIREGPPPPSKAPASARDSTSTWSRWTPRATEASKTRATSARRRRPHPSRDARR